MKKKYFTPELKIALVAIAGVVILFFGIQFLKGLDLFATTTSYKMHFDSVDGLSVTTPVYANGVKVGAVKGIYYDYEHPEKEISVDVNIDKSMKIPEGTTAEILSDLMGNVKMNLILGRSSNYMKPGDVIEGGVNGGTLGGVRDLIPSVQQLMPKLDSILMSVNSLLADPALRNVVHNADKISADLTTSTRELNMLLAQLNGTVPGMMGKADRLLDNASGAMKNIDGGITDARGTIKSANGMITTLDNKVADIDLAGTMYKVNTALEHVNALTAKLNSNEGSLGMLINDPTFYNNLNKTMRSADSLLINIKAHPKRYVHFSLFGRKDK